MRYLILGAGPAGLAFANRLRQRSENDFLVIEKEDTAGGLCRSVNVDGAPLDIGGGHFLDVRRRDVNEFLFSFLPEEEWRLYERDSRIVVNGNMIGHPMEANIWQMDVTDQVEYLKSIATAGCNLGAEIPETFIDWIYWKLGSKIAGDYMIPYNQKMFGKDLNRLGTYWLEKLPNVSFEETLLSCLERKAHGSQPAHAQFYYPKKYGYGELWLRMADAIKGNIVYGTTVKAIDFVSKSAITDGGERYQADIIVTTVPWAEFEELFGMPGEIKNSVKELKYSSIQIEYVPKNLDTEAHWIYYPDPELSYHRILVRHNFCPGSRGYWTETNGGRLDERAQGDRQDAGGGYWIEANCGRLDERAQGDRQDAGGGYWIEANGGRLRREGGYAYRNRYAYPLNTIGKPAIMERLIAWSREHNVYGLGRWGEHRHYNSDVTVEKAMEMADILAGSESCH